MTGVPGDLDDTELVDMSYLASGLSAMSAESAGRMWIVLPALLPRFWPGAGVRSEAWVPA